jgi:hypothetical protein
VKCILRVRVVLVGVIGHSGLLSTSLLYIYTIIGYVSESQYDHCFAQDNSDC